MVLFFSYLYEINYVMVLQIVVHFSASWCMPSVAMNPVFEELASSFQEVLFLMVDVDDAKVRI